MGPSSTSVRILVVGGGVMGTSIALHAARRLSGIEQPVMLLERAELASGSSGRSGAVLRQFYADRELVLMARDSLREYAGFERKTGYPLGFRRAGVLSIAGPGDPARRARLLANVETMRSAGVRVELLESEAMRRRVPGLAVSDGSLGAFEPDGGFADPLQTVSSFAALARFHGATVREHEPVLGMVREGGRVTRIEAPRGPIVADQVVLAAGPWNRRLLAELGCELPLSVVVPPQLFVESIEPPPGARAEAAPEPEGVGPEAELAARLQGERPAPLSHPVVLDLEHNVYARCEPATARTRVGELDYADARAIDSPDDFVDQVGDAFAARAHGALARRLPAYADREEAQRQAAMYTLSPDLQPVLGRVPGLANVFVAGGFSGHGFKLAPSIGLGLAQLLLGEPITAFDPAFFAPERFAAGAARCEGGSFGL